MSLDRWSYGRDRLQRILFYLVAIDLFWWRNTKRIRFSFLPEKFLYQAAGKHIGSFLRGIILFAAVAVLSAGIVTLFG